MSSQFIGNEIFLQIDNENFQSSITFYWDGEQYISDPNETGFDKVPKNIERILLLKNIIKYIEKDINIYYILIDIHCETMIGDSIISIQHDKRQKIEDTQSSIDRSSTIAESSYKFNEEDTTESIVSKLMSNYGRSSRSSISGLSIDGSHRSLKKRDTESSYSYDTKYTDRDISERSYPHSSYSKVKTIEEKAKLSKEIKSEFKFTPMDKFKPYISESSRNYQPSTPTQSITKKRDNISPDDYKDRTDKFRNIKRKFVFEEFINDEFLDESELIGLYAKQDNGNVYIYDDNSSRINSSFTLIKKVHINKLLQAKYIIKGYFSLNTCVMTEKSGLIVVNNIDINDFINQISPALVIL